MSQMIKQRYILIKKIGEGGMADVYLAMDTLLNREVAIKILRGELSNDPINLVRFQREANAASGISHPNIVEIYDVGEENGQHFIVMENVKGKTLKQLIQQRGAIDLDESLVIMKQVVAGLTQAHKHDIVHRDIKPQNILMKDDGTAKIADFGIARAQGATQLTQIDSVMGSVHYMAPESARGESATNQSDIYALGVVFYELLVGDVPYNAETSVQVALKHMKDDMPSVIAFNPTIPQSVQNIITKATAKNKFFRYKNINEMLDDLDTCLDKNKQSEKPIIFDDEQGNTILMDQMNGTHNEEPTSSTLKTTLVGVLISIIILSGMWYAVAMFNRSEQEKFVSMPDINGMTFAQARDTLEELGLHLSTSVRYQLTDDVDFGRIINFSPDLGSEVEIGSSVNVWISDGKYYVVKDYTGMKLEEVQQELATTRIVVRVEKEQSQDIAPGIIIRQEQLLPGDQIDPRVSREMKLVVSTYVEIVVPPILGLDVDVAISQLRELGVEVVSIKKSTEGYSEEKLAEIEYGVVVEVSPSVGSLYSQFENSSITLYYY